MAWAIAASAVLHLWIVEGVSTAVRRATTQPPASALAVRLEHSSATRQEQEAVRSVAAIEAADATPAVPTIRDVSRPAQPSAGNREYEQPRVSVADARLQDAHQSLPAPVDPVYYAARDLDIYPSPAIPLRFGYPPHLMPAGPTGSVLLSVKVDESGVVDHAAVIAADPPGHFEDHTRSVLAAARFNPARRAGRAVKSQVMVRVDYDPATREGALR